MPHWPKPLGFRPSDFSLERITQVLNKLDNPEKKLSSVIHVAGTNGKGSTISFIKHILQSSGLKVNVYTSPHLVNFNERIVLNGEMITDRYLFDILEECRNASQGIPITFFEGTTIAALLAFSRVKSDITLIETGMGGRLDATNVVNPLITIITSISLDHVQYLGPTVEIIAGEKSGIIKNNVVCIVAPQQDSVIKVIKYYALMNQAHLFVAGIDWTCEARGENIIFTDCDLSKILFPLPRLLGDHQIINAGNAIIACRILNSKYGYNITENDISNGISRTYWPARLEQITKGKLLKKMPDNWKLFLDGAHNIAGAESLAAWIQSLVDKEEVYLIVGMTKDRNCGEFLKRLYLYVKGIYAVCVCAEPMSQTAEQIVDSSIKANIKVVACESIADAVSRIVTVGNKNLCTTILVCGSLFLAGDLLSEYC